MVSGLIKKLNLYAQCLKSPKILFSEKTVKAKLTFNMKHQFLFVLIHCHEILQGVLPVCIKLNLMYKLVPVTTYRKHCLYN